MGNADKALRVQAVFQLVQAQPQKIFALRRGGVDLAAGGIGADNPVGLQHLQPAFPAAGQQLPRFFPQPADQPFQLFVHGGGLHDNLGLGAGRVDLDFDLHGQFLLSPPV